MCVVLRNRDRGDELKPPQIRIVENRYLRHESERRREEYVILQRMVNEVLECV